MVVLAVRIEQTLDVVAVDGRRPRWPLAAVTILVAT
jgi:hypothetical protein